MAWIEEFKKFIQRGNVIDLAVAVIIGTAFGKIVTSLVGDILMPVVGMATNNVDISGLKFVVTSPNDPAQVLVTLAYGKFLQASIDFLIISFCVFWLVKGVNVLHKPEVPKPPEPTATEKLLVEIRDLLKSKPESPAIQ